MTLTQSSQLPRPPEAVWRHVTSMPEINREMGPWLHMTYPAEARTLSLADAAVQVGQPLFNSWILFLGLVPVERMQVTLAEIEPGRRFVEQSGVMLMRFWRHERSVVPTEGGCLVSDVVTLEPPFVWFAPLLKILAGLFFSHRHRRLRQLLP